MFSSDITRLFDQGGPAEGGKGLGQGADLP